MSGFHATKSRSDFQDDRAAFTLVEMLVVMGILVILLVVTVPAFRGLNQGGARRAAVSNLMGVLDHARMMAVSDGKATYVVFYASSTPPTGAVTDNQRFWGRAYAIYEDKDNVNFTPEQRTPWLYLPAGVAFKVDGSTSATSSVTNQTPTAPSDPAFPIAPSAGVNGATALMLPYWKFDATGAIDEPTLNHAIPASGTAATYLRVLMFSGSLDPNAAHGELSTQSGTGGTNLVAGTLEEVDVNPVTGRAKYIVNAADNLVTPSPTSSPQS